LDNFFIRSDNTSSCHMVMLQCAPHMGHVVTFHFHPFKKKVYTELMKQHHIIVLDKDV